MFPLDRRSLHLMLLYAILHEMSVVVVPMKTAVVMNVVVVTWAVVGTALLGKLAMSLAYPRYCYHFDVVWMTF